VIDFDLDGPVSASGLATSFAYDSWHAMASNGIMSNRKALYDTIEFVSVESKAKPLSKDSFNFSRTLFQRGEPPQRVKSAYGGCVLYNLKPIIEKDVQYVVPDDFVVSEHVGFHLAMINQGLDKIYVNPSFIVLHLTR
jgi:hypothetical protein